MTSVQATSTTNGANSGLYSMIFPPPIRRRVSLRQKSSLLKST
jgi:hypothetical protein